MDQINNNYSSWNILKKRMFIVGVYLKIKALVRYLAKSVIFKIIFD